MDRIGVVDTMFARYDMGAEALDELGVPGFGDQLRGGAPHGPGFKDLAVECKRLIENEGCHIVVALGHAGQGRHRPGVRPRGVPGHHARPADDLDPHPRGLRPRERGGGPGQLAAVCVDRARKHARNAYWMLYEPEQLTRRAGQGVRQGYGDAGPIGCLERPAARPGRDRGAPGCARR